MGVTLAIVGAGAIGGHIARAVEGRDRIDRVLVCDRIAKRARDLAEELDKVEAVSLQEAVDGAWLVVEAASRKAVAEVGRPALAAGRTLVVMSVGAFSDPDLEAELRDLAKAHGGRILCPSGAIGALDALRAAGQGGLSRVKLTTTKSPASLGIDDVGEVRTLFSGPARRAVEEYPRNVNVAAALSLAGIGFDDTEVEIVVDPDVDRNRHRVDAEGAFGRFTFEVENEPAPSNPRTSFLAALSAVELLSRIDAHFVVGG